MTEQQPDVANRPVIVRRTIAERDPSNENAVRLLGEELTDKLVRSLWGGDRAECPLRRSHQRVT